MRLMKPSTIAMAALTLGLGLIACGDEPPAGPEGAASSASAKPGATAEPIKRPDPIVTKTYRADACYYGSLALKQARDAYVASLGGAEPSADKIPQFGSDPDDAKKDDGATPTPTPAGSGAPTAAPTAKSTAAPTAKPTAAATAKPTAKPTAAATAKPTAAATGTAAATADATGAASAAIRPPMPPEKMRQQVRFDQFIRHCNTAITVKDAPDPDLDAALKEFSEYALPFSKVIQEANSYYTQEKYKEDDFKQGKTYHACLTGTGTCETKDKNAKPVSNAFSQLDEKLAKLKAAVDKYKGAKPVDKGAFEESQKVSDEAVQQATDLLLAFDAKPVDTAKAKTALAALEATTEKLKGFGEGKDKPDPWAKAVPPQLSLLITEAKALVEKAPEEITPAKIYKIVSIHNRVLEKNFSALQTKLREASGGRPMGPAQRKLQPKLPPNHPK
ncbi:MAG: DUF3829 domain-containing protein [Polyangiaceae bacterium]|nr:DUF3829 domain-containing protein [Polyangiaceae bacterium]